MIVFVCRGCDKQFVSLRSCRDHAREACFCGEYFNAEKHIIAKDI